MAQGEEIIAAAAKRPERRIRSDVARNRERLLDVAKDVFARKGSVASLEAVAREAGLGIATLYRHFPTREALYEAVYRRDIDQMVVLGKQALTDTDPVQGLRRWLHALVESVATKKGMIAAFALTTDTTSAVSARFSGRLVGSLEPLLGRAIAAGRLQSGIAAQDLMLAVIGMCVLRDQPGWQASVITLIDALIDGLRRAS